MSYLFESNTSGSSLSTMSENDVRKLYSQIVKLSEQENDFWQEFEGPGPDRFIWAKSDTSKGAGHTIRFTNTTGFYMEGRMGEEYFDDPDRYEQNRINGFELSVDWLRNAARINARAEEHMGLRGQLKAKIPQNLASWMGREKAYRIDQLFLKRGEGRNTMYAGSRASLDEITSTDILSLTEFLRMKQELIRVGAQPGMVGTAGRNKIHKYMCVATTDALTELKKSTTYQQLVRDAGARGEYNPLFRGGYVDLDGQVIKERFVLDHDGPGPIGSSLNPRARLGNAIAAGTATFTIKGGGSTAWADLKYTPYFRAFPDFPVEFTPSDTITAGTANFYVAIINPSTAATDPGKWGFYRCNANGWSSDVNVLTVNQRLGSAAGGSRATQVGNVTWDGDVNSDVHAVGSTIVLCNANAVPIGYSLMLGQSAAYRGYGMWRNNIEVERHEGSGRGAFIMDTYIQSVFGQCLRKDMIDRYPGYVVLAHAISIGQDLNPTLA